MTLRDVSYLSEHWTRSPPLRALVAACAASLGVELPDPDKPDAKYLTADDAKRLLAATGGKIEGLANHG